MISLEDIKSNYKIWLQIKSKSVSYSKESLYNRFFRQYKREQITKDDFLLLKNALKDIPQKYSEKIEFRKYINFMEKNFSYTYAGKKLYKNKSINAYKSELTKFMLCRDMTLEDIADIFDIEPEMLKGDVFNPDVISLIKKLIDIDEKKS